MLFWSRPPTVAQCSSGAVLHPSSICALHRQQRHLAMLPSSPAPQSRGQREREAFRRSGLSQCMVSVATPVPPDRSEVYRPLLTGIRGHLCPSMTGTYAPPGGSSFTPLDCLIGIPVWHLPLIEGALPGSLLPLLSPVISPGTLPLGSRAVVRSWPIPAGWASTSPPCRPPAGLLLRTASP